MGKIDELIQQYCPEGVEWKKIEEVCKVKTPPAKLKTSDYQEQGLFLIIDQGQQQYAGYTDNEKAVVEDGEYILYGDHTCIVKYHKGRFAQGADGLKILVSKANNSKYVYYAFSAYNLTSTEYKRHWTQAKEIEIPLPPLPVQEAIVNILDRFAVYAAELQAELQERQQQYNYYRDTLLSFEGRDDVQWKKLGEVAEIGDGLHGTPHYSKNTGYYFINGNNLHNGIIEYDINTKQISKEEYGRIKFDLNENTLLMSINGTIGNIAYYNGEKIALGKSAAFFKVNPNHLFKKFLYYYLQSAQAHHYYELVQTGSTIKNLGLKSLREMKIPVPSLTEQERIASILDRFDTLVNDLAQGLPAEIEARRQQYEYYRDKLLTFKRK